MSIPQGGAYDITIFQGGNFTRTFALKESDGTTVRPLTGYSAGQAQMRDRPGGELLADFTVDIDEPAGEVTIALTAADTALLVQSGVYDIALLNDNNIDVILPFVQGRATLDRRVTVVEAP